MDRARAGRGGRFQGVRRRDDVPGRHGRADLRPGDRRRQPGRGPGRLRPDRRRRPPGRAERQLAGQGIATFDCEYGFSCMGYELAGAWGARMARRAGEVIAFVGDGSYLMSNSELYSSVLSGHKLVVVLCDNGGYAVIDRLQVGQGGAAFNNLFRDVGPHRVEVDWVSACSLARLPCRASRDARRPRRGARACARGRPHVGDRAPHGARRLDGGRRVLGGGRAGGERAGGGHAARGQLLEHKRAVGGLVGDGPHPGRRHRHRQDRPSPRRAGRAARAGSRARGRVRHGHPGAEVGSAFGRRQRSAKELIASPEVDAVAVCSSAGTPST